VTWAPLLLVGGVFVAGIVIKHGWGQSPADARSAAARSAGIYEYLIPCEAGFIPPLRWAGGINPALQEKFEEV